MKESLGKSLGTFLDERVSNPIIGSFILSWCGWNYKFFIALFSNNTVSETIRIIEKVLYPNWVICTLQGFLFPIGSVVLYLWLVPILTKHYYKLTAKTRKAQDEAMYEAEKHKRLSTADSAELQDTVRRIQEELDNQTSKVERLKGELNSAFEQNNRWQASINNLQSELQTAKNEAESLRNTLAEQFATQEKIRKERNATNQIKDFQVAKHLTNAEVIALRSIADSSSSMVLASLANLSMPKLSQAEASSALNALKEQGLISHEKSGVADFFYSITQAGIDALINRSILDAVLDSSQENQNSFDADDMAPFFPAAREITDLEAQILSVAADSSFGSTSISGLETKTNGYDALQIALALEQMEKRNYVQIRHDVPGGAIAISSIGKAINEAKKHLSKNR
jgi:DNA repair exonuclease SbcCD ATPase subunit